MVAVTRLSGMLFVKAILITSYMVNHPWAFQQAQEITTVFNPTDLTCEKCTVSTKCAKTKAPMFGDQYCLEWEKESQKDCVTVEF